MKGCFFPLILATLSSPHILSQLPVFADKNNSILASIFSVVSGLLVSDLDVSGMCSCGSLMVRLCFSEGNHGGLLQLHWSLCLEKEEVDEIGDIDEIDTRGQCFTVELLFGAHNTRAERGKQVIVTGLNKS